MSTFESFDWSSSKEWKSYEDNLYIPPGPDYDRLLQNRKQRWYQTNIDPQYQIKELNSSSQNNTTNTQTNAKSKENPTSNQSSSQSTNDSSSDSSRTSHSTSSSTSTSSQSNSRSWNIPKITSYTQLTLHSITLVLSLFLILPFTSEWLRSISFSTILVSNLITLMISIARTHGRPQLNQQMAIKLARDENAHFIFYTFILFAASHAFIYILPFVVRSAVFVCAALPVILPQYSPSLYNRIEAPLIAIRAQCTKLQHSNSLFEIIAFGYSLMKLFTSERSFVLVLLQLQYLRIRAMISPDSQSAWQQVGVITDSLFNQPWMPQQIHGLYYRARTYLSHSIAPAQTR